MGIENDAVLAQIQVKTERHEDGSRQTQQTQQARQHGTHGRVLSAVAVIRRLRYLCSGTRARKASSSFALHLPVRRKPHGSIGRKLAALFGSPLPLYFARSG